MEPHEILEAKDDLRRRLRNVVEQRDRLRTNSAYGGEPGEPMFDPAVKRSWVQRLRQPGTQQAFGELRRDTLHPDSSVTSAFCCLGVLCELAAEKQVISPGRVEEELGLSPSEGAELATETRVLYAGDHEMPPGQVSRWGVTGTRNTDLIFSIYGKLANANDSGLPFPDIADVIEEVL